MYPDICKINYDPRPKRCLGSPSAGGGWQVMVFQADYLLSRLLDTVAMEKGPAVGDLTLASTMVTFYFLNVSLHLSNK